jgi:hypothetical protein
MIWGLLTALQTITLYILVIVPTEYYLTEYTQTLKFITSQTKTLIFIPIFLIVFSINYFLIKKNKKYWLPITLLFVASLIGFSRYRQYYSYLQQFPEIYSLSSDWSIQGKKITIDGKNFGSVNDQSSVKVGDIEFLINQWSNTEIVVTQPLVDDFGQKELYIYRADNNKQSKKIPFEIRDPADLAN